MCCLHNIILPENSGGENGFSILPLSAILDTVMPLQDYDSITIKPEFEGTLGKIDAINRDRKRTKGKDEVARYIVEEVLADNRWPIMMTQLAEETGYSRQHCANVISDYFEPVTDSRDSQPNSQSQSRADRDQSTNTSQTMNTDQSKTVFVEINGIMQELEIPEGVDRASYVQGWADCAKQK